MPGRRRRNPQNVYRGPPMTLGYAVTAKVIIGWIILGLIAGLIVGGWLFESFGRARVTGFDLYSMLVAIVGAIVVLVIYHLIRRAA
jgi:uncharacterized membrane protein YeaQ/YmgE (transglycosylase-associated protein family)